MSFARAILLLLPLVAGCERLGYTPVESGTSDTDIRSFDASADSVSLDANTDHSSLDANTDRGSLDANTESALLDADTDSASFDTSADTAAIDFGVDDALDSGTDSASSDAGPVDTGGDESAVVPPDTGNDPLLFACAIWLRMEESAWTGVPGEAADDCGGDNPGQSLGGATTIIDSTRGSVGHFNVASGLIVDDAPVLRPTTALTLSAWVRATALDGTSPFGIISKRINLGVEMSFQLSLFTNNWYYVDIDADDDRFGLPPPASNDVWNQVTVTYDATLTRPRRVRLYVNGSFVGDGAESSATIPQYTSPLYIGDNPPFADNTRHFIGDLDDVVIWTRTLSDAEVGAWFARTTL